MSAPQAVAATVRRMIAFLYTGQMAGETDEDVRPEVQEAWAISLVTGLVDARAKSHAVNALVCGGKYLSRTMPTGKETLQLLDESIVHEIASQLVVWAITSDTDSAPYYRIAASALRLVGSPDAALYEAFDTPSEKEA